MKKVLVAFSGGLDTSFCVVWLKEKGYEVHTVSVNTGGWSEDDEIALHAKALQLGAKSHHNIDAQQEIYDTVIAPLIKLNGLYQGEYPLMCADRYLIVEKTVALAKELGISTVAHGCTAQGNDQVRFDAAFAALAPDIEVLTPVRDLEPSRQYELDYLDQHGFATEDQVKAYSINSNVFGTTVSGSEIDKFDEPADNAYTMTSNEPVAEPAYVVIGFDKGLPTSLNGVKMDGLDILEALNTIVGSYGYGRVIYTGDCIIGIKGHLMFEAPGLLTLVEAHKKLEHITLTKSQLAMNNNLSNTWADLVYSGLYYEPLTSDIEAFASSVQKNVSGKVLIKLEPNRMQIVGLDSPNTLSDDAVAVYAQSASWKPDEVKGFIKFHTMQQSLVG